MRNPPSNSSLHGQLTNEVQNGVSIARTYDALSRPMGYRLMQNGGASPPGEPFAVSYAYDALGRFSSVTAGRDALVASASFAYTSLPSADLVSGSAFGTLSGATDAYGYNGRSEVVSARRDLGGEEVRGFGHDCRDDEVVTGVESGRLKVEG